MCNPPPGDGFLNEAMTAHCLTGVSVIVRQLSA